MVFSLWAYICIVLKPEKPVIEGLRERVSELSKNLGPITKNEIISLAIVAVAIVIMSLQVMIPPLRALDKSAIFLVSTILFFVLKILDIDDLELIPWNIVLLFAGAMSIGYCLWQTGAAQWLAINWLALFKNAHWLVFVLGVAFFVLVLTNFIMNVAAIAISLPVALVIAKYLSVAPDVVMFSSLATAGMPFLLLVGAAPNAIAYDSKQFSSGEFILLRDCAKYLFDSDPWPDVLRSLALYGYANLNKLAEEEGLTPVPSFRNGAIHNDSLRTRNIS